MLSLPNDGRYPTLELTPQQRRQKTLEALIAQIEALSRSNPVLMIFEDVHWIDPTSLELLGRTVDRLRTLGVLLIVTFRPEFEPPWVGRPYVTALSLNRLGEREIAAMIDRVTGNNALPEGTRRRVMKAGLLFRQGSPPHASYIFKHALIQDAAYSTMLRARRQQLHSTIAQILEAKFRRGGQLNAGGRCAAIRASRTK